MFNTFISATQEMIQNAEDAGASTIKIFSDRREFNGQPDKVTLKHHPHLKYFKVHASVVCKQTYSFKKNDF